MVNKLLSLSLTFSFLSLPVSAELYKLSFKGDKLRGLAALDLRLDIKPLDSFELDEELNIYYEDSDEKVDLKEEDLLYKFVDPENAFIRLFFKTPLEANNLFIDGGLNRTNYSGTAEVKFAEISFISGFARDIDSEKIKREIEIIDEADILPFYGISKANILGPKKLIYRPKVYVTINNIESYGFNLDFNTSKAKINGFPARLINNEIITGEIPLQPEMIGKDLEIILDIEVDNKVVSKNIGSIRIVEAI